MERNIRLDYFKVILSFLVITVHIQDLWGEESLLGWFISNGIARIAVPIFFIISGYYIIQKLNNSQVLKRYLLHTLIVYIVWSVIYLPVYYDTIDSRSFITFALLGYYHLWFLPALLMGILILKGIKIFIKNDSLVLLIGILLFISGYFMENIELPYRTFYNGVFFGFPFISLGYYIRNHNLERSIKTPYLCVILFISLILLFTESYLGYKVRFYHNIFMSLYLLCPVLFMCVIKVPQLISKPNNIGKFAAGIYFVHILVATLIIPISETNNIYKLPSITIVSILLSIFIVIINKRIKIFL
ncbi:acyltransferase family protein [Dysgonomonas sp. Marseille-P4677]|uniref:acyltransferase family protein n=1 Tax=Dysgonomonas sp. Marseille-P4677 TaxID=2364790 RepID=UPI001911820A|nr:acyltransferase family protein [Dysgonomonas sp. Marseille-P4677]